MSTINANVQYANAANAPLRFADIFPGSVFRITAEPSRGLTRVRDGRLYRKARDGFYAENISSKEGCVLMPEDLCMPVRRVKQGR